MEFLRARERLFPAIRVWEEGVARFDTRRNPFLRRIELALFVARKRGEASGCVAAAVDHLYPEPDVGLFGFFAAGPGEHDTSAALLRAAAAWLAQRGKSYMVGPVGLHTTGEIGVEVSHAPEATPMPAQGYGVSCRELLEGAGMSKLKDFLAYQWDCRQALPERILRVSERAWRMPGLKVRAVDWRHLYREAGIFAAIYNAALSANWGFSPLTHGEALALLRQYRRWPEPVLLLLAEVGSRPAGVLLALPTRSPGRPPLRLALLAVVPEFRRRGIHALLVTVATRAAREYGHTSVELSFVAEDNGEVRRLIEALPGSQLVRRHRVYLRRLEKE
ncbi:MAG: GNAT family N-acetyltransferase [Desulfotomaculales bacterium]